MRQPVQGEKSELRLGVDLGGTKVEAVLLRYNPPQPPQELLRSRVPTQQQRGYEAVVKTVSDLIHSALSQCSLSLNDVCIGVGMPGGIRRKDGRVKNSNTTCLNGRPFRQDLESLLGRPIAFENDANCFALAEAKLGAARAYSKGLVFGVIMGTGVGGGLVLDGKLWPGPQGIAGEWGHHRLYCAELDSGLILGRSCYCGQSGCVETYLSGPGVEKDYERRSGCRLSLAQIAEQRENDPHAEACIALFVDSFGRALANVVNILDPSVIVLGGGVSNLDLLYDEGAKSLARYVFNDECRTPLVRHALGDSAGVLGAALLDSEP